MKTKPTRREFIKQAALAGVGISTLSQARLLRAVSPNEKLNIGIIGVSNRGRDNLNGVASHNIVALCDVDETYLAAAGEQFPQARKHRDFRKLLEQRDLDAVVISTTDHTHAVATVGALETGRHVYCEKPLTHTISEARIVARKTREQKRVTQMGTQIHAGNNYRRVVELVQSGAIGPVREVHHWVGSVWSGRPPSAEKPPVPDHLDWDLWLGPARHRPYDSIYHPAQWRGFWDFGGGAMSDMGCHHMDLSFWALGLRFPTSVEAEGPALDEVVAPPWLIARYEFPARGEQPPVKLTWYNGDKRPDLVTEGKIPNWGGGTLFIGDKGMLLADYGRHLLLPEKEFEGFVRPDPFIPDSIGHYAEWLEACKTGGETTCNFDYAGALTESVLLGNVAYRTGRKIYWDPENLQATNAPEAKRFIQHRYREGWKI